MQEDTSAEGEGKREGGKEWKWGKDEKKISHGVKQEEKRTLEGHEQEIENEMEEEEGAGGEGLDEDEDGLLPSRPTARMETRGRSIPR